METLENSFLRQTSFKAVRDSSESIRKTEVAKKEFNV
jgi:hypothetical protein